MKKKYSIYVFGNVQDPNDSISIRLIPYLIPSFPSVSFLHKDPTENWYCGEKNIIILDAVKGISKPTFFTDLSSFTHNHLITPHDYDVYLDLSLLIKLKKVKEVLIIAIPLQTKLSKKLIHQVEKIIRKSIQSIELLDKK